MGPSYFKGHPDLLSTTEKHLANNQRGTKKKKLFRRSLEHTSNCSHERVDIDKKQNKASGQSFSGLTYRQRKGFMTRELSINKTT